MLRECVTHKTSLRSSGASPTAGESSIIVALLSAVFESTLCHLHENQSTFCLIVCQGVANWIPRAKQTGGKGGAAKDVLQPHNNCVFVLMML